MSQSMEAKVYIIPSRLRRRQLIFSVVFGALGILWMLGPRTEALQWGLVVFFLLVWASLLWSWVILPTRLSFGADSLTVTTLLGNKILSYTHIYSVRVMAQPLWWGRKYPALLIRYEKRNVLIAGLAEDSAEWEEVKSKVESQKSKV